MLAELKELWGFRELLFSMIERELRIRYKNSFFGFFWSLLNPLVTMTVMTAVFKYILNNPVENYSAYVLAAYLPYMFFQLAVLDSAQSVISALPVVKKVYFPREILPLAAIGSNFVHLILALGVFLLYLLFIWIRNPEMSPFTWNLLYLPPLLLLNAALTVGVGLMVSALNTFYEDVKYIVSVGLYILFFLCPVMYFSDQVYNSPAIASSPYRELIYTLFNLNPLALLCRAYRRVMVAPHSTALPLEPEYVLINIAVCLGTLYFGYALFNRLKWRFAERP